MPNYPRKSRNKGIYALTLADKIAKFTQTGENGCIQWIGATNPKGYGTTTYKGQAWLAHRLMYSEVVGPIPEGMVIDHLCRNPSCVNVKHLEPVTNEENLARGLRPWGSKPVTHCPRGHEYTPDNTSVGKNGGRTCRKCKLLRYYETYKPKKASTVKRFTEIYRQLSA
jgi:hypothetical protein